MSGREILVLDGVPAIKRYSLYRGHETPVPVIFYRKRENDYRLWWYPGSFEINYGMPPAQRAIDAARSARFEFGESG